MLTLSTSVLSFINGGTLVNKWDLLAVYLSWTYCHKTGTGPPSFSLFVVLTKHFFFIFSMILKITRLASLAVMMGTTSCLHERHLGTRRTIETSVLVHSKASNRYYWPKLEAPRDVLKVIFKAKLLKNFIFIWSVLSSLAPLSTS